MIWVLGPGFPISVPGEARVIRNTGKVVWYREVGRSHDGHALILDYFGVALLGASDGMATRNRRRTWQKEGRGR
jgi:hypothetical protein